MPIPAPLRRTWRQTSNPRRLSCDRCGAIPTETRVERHGDYGTLFVCTTHPIPPSLNRVERLDGDDHLYEPRLIALCRSIVRNLRPAGAR